MKKIFIVFSSSAMIATAILLGGCNNAAEVKKQQDAENANIQSQVDSKLSGLQSQADQECSAAVDSAANAQFAVWKEEEAKGKKGGAHKPAPKPVVKKEDPKTVGNGKPKLGNQDDKTVGNGKPKLGGNTDGKTVGNGKPKLGGGN